MYQPPSGPHALDARIEKSERFFKTSRPSTSGACVIPIRALRRCVMSESPCDLSCGGRFLGRPVFPASLRKQVPPPQGNHFIGPVSDDIWPRSGHDVKVVTHHRKAENIHSKDPGEHFQRSSLPPSQTLSSLSLDVAQLLPLLPMLTTVPTQQRPPHTP